MSRKSGCKGRASVEARRPGAAGVAARGIACDADYAAILDAVIADVLSDRLAPARAGIAVRAMRLRLAHATAIERLRAQGKQALIERKAA